MKAQDARSVQATIDKYLGKAQVLISKSQANADPAKNAELMHSLQQAGKDLERAMGLVSDARTMAAAVCTELVMVRAMEEAAKAEA